MLYYVAALITSVALGPVAGVVDAPVNPPAVAVAAQVSQVSPMLQAPKALPGGPTPPFVGPVAGPATQSQGMLLLQQLSLLGPDGIRTFAGANPDALAGLLDAPPAATAVTEWWGALDAASRAALRYASPELVGNLDGVPYTVRDRANRSTLSSTIDSLEQTVDSDAGRTVVENAKQQLKMLRSIDAALGRSADQEGTKRTLMTLDVTGQGRAAIILGDLSKAEYVTYLVPGMFFTIENQMGDWVDAAVRLHDEQLSWLAVLGSSEATVATVAWIGYPTPNLTNVGGIENAYEGRDALAGAIMGLQALRGADEPHVTVVAHSYGSTAALMALTEYDFEVDALAMVGSPGSPAKSVNELHVRDGNVWVGEAAWDPIPNSAYFGSDPGSASYGAKRMGVSGGRDPITAQLLSASFGHNEYFSPGTESMRNFALIGIGQGQYVSGGE